MKVSELIDILQQHNPDEDVFMYDNVRDQLFGVHEATREYAHINVPDWGIITYQTEEELTEIYRDKEEDMPQDYRYVVVLRDVQID